MKLYNFIVPSYKSTLKEGHIEAGELLNRINLHDGSEAYHCLFDLEKREDYKGYQGLHYPASGWVIIDIDFDHTNEDGSINIEQNIEAAKAVVLNIWESLKLNEQWARIFFSGSKGFHIYIRSKYFGIDAPSENASKQVKDAIEYLSKKFKFKYDQVVYHANRKFRMPSSQNPKSGLFKTELDIADLKTLSATEIKQKATKPSLSTLDVFTEPTESLHIETKQDSLPTFGTENLIQDDTQKFSNTITNKPCIEKMVAGGLDTGERHQAMLAIVHDCIQTKIEKSDAIEKIITFCDKNKIPERRKEYLKTLELAYQGSFPYQSGCYSGIKHKLCSGKCPIYKRLDKEKRAKVHDEPINDFEQKSSSLIIETAIAEAFNGRMPEGHAAMSSFIASKLGEFMLYDEYKEKWFIYYEPMWQAVQDGQVMRLITRVLDRHFNTYSRDLLSGVLFFLKIRLGKSPKRSIKHAISDSWNADKNLIPLQNGVLNLTTMKLEQHSPKFFFNWALPYDYDESATCEEFHKLVDWLSQGDEQTKQTIYCFLAAIIRGRSDLQKYLEIIGMPGTGKSSLIQVAKNLVGNENTVSSTMRELGKNRFETSGFFGKKLAFFSDAQNWVEGADVFKALTGQDPVRYEEKNIQQTAPFIFGGMIIVAANRPVVFDDQSTALMRRRITINIDKKLDSSRKKQDFLEKLIEEMPGIFNYIIKIDNETISKVLNEPRKESSARTLIETNPIAEWIDENCILDKNSMSSVGVAKREDNGYEGADRFLYANYCQWSEQTGKKNPTQLKNFTKTVVEILQHFDVDVELKRTKTGKKIVGLRLRLDYDTDATPISKATLD